ncbi:MAG: carbohydrate-binding family 9-like protein [Blastocatellia bacterium]
MSKSSQFRIAHTSTDFPVSELANKSWEKADTMTIDKYWSGKTAPAGRHFEADLLWSDTALYVRFVANQSEPLVVSDRPNLKSKMLGLWDRDVCEIFIAPNTSEPRKYFEFEVAPNGEWIDLAIDLTSGKRDTDWDYVSGMESAAKIEKDRVVMAVKIPWNAFGKTPKAGDVWLGNLFRCIGKDPDRGYLAWQPTMTEVPSFHVPEKFGEFVFTK